MTADASATARAGSSADATKSGRNFYVLGLVVGGGLLAAYELLPASPYEVTGPQDIKAGRFFSIMLGFYVAMTPMLSRAGARDVARLRGLPSSRREVRRRSVSRPSLPCRS